MCLKKNQNTFDVELFQKTQSRKYCVLKKFVLKILFQKTHRRTYSIYFEISITRIMFQKS